MRRTLAIFVAVLAMMSLSATPVVLAQDAEASPELASEEPTTDAVGDDGGAAMCMGQEVGPCPLDAATYVLSGLFVPVQLTVGEGWTNYFSYPDAIALVHGDDIFSYVVGPLELEDGTSIASVDAMSDYLATSEAIDAADPEVSTVGGRPATVIDITATQSIPTIFLIDEDVYFLDAGDRARFMLVDADETFGAFIIEGYGANGLEGAIEVAQPVLDSVVWLSADGSGAG